MSGGDWPWSRRLRPVLQSEAAECGLAAIVMIAQHHGHRVNLTGLRQRFPTSIKGLTLQNLVAIAAELELAPRPVRLEIDELAQLQLPAILHWDLNHFVVVESVSGSKATILDPAVGRKTMPLDTMGKHFTGVALELTPTAKFKPFEARPRTRLSDLWSKLNNFHGAFTQVLLLSLMLQLMALIAPFFIQLVVDEAVGQGDANLMFLLLIGFGLVYALQGIIRALRDWVTLTLGQSLSFQLAGNVVRHLLRLPVGYFERRHVGDLLSRIGSISPIQSLLTHGLVSLIIDAFAIPAFAPGSPGELLVRRPDIRASEARIQAAGGDVTAARAAFFPRLRLSASGLAQAASLGGPVGTILSIGADLLAPIFNRGRLHGEFDAASARQRESVELYRRDLLNALAEVENAISAGNRSREREQLILQSVEEARLTSRLARLSYIEGESDLRYVLDAESLLVQAEDARALALQQRLEAAIDLFRATGGRAGA